MFAYGHPGKWALGRLGKGGTLSALTGYHKCPVLIFPKFFSNGQWGKWVFGANGHLGERGTPNGLKGYSKCPVLILPKFLQMDIGANGRLGQMDN